MKVEVLPADELGGQHVECWSELQMADPDLFSPFFRPEFFAAVAGVRRDVFVGSIEDAGRPVGFFPFQRGPLGVGKPVGGSLSDHHGVILERAVEIDPPALLRACGLRAWDFTHLVVSQRPFVPYHVRVHPSPILDLSGGFAEYRRLKSSAGSSVIAQADRKARKLAREVGPLRFVADDGDRGALQQLMRWKSRQYQRTKVTDTFASRWRTELIERIHATRTPCFAGVLSTLRAGERLVAAHLGMRTRDALHWWFPSFDAQLARYSPGVTLLMQLATAAEEWGVGVIDLGVGDEHYKRRLMTGSVPLAEGAVTLRGSLTAVRQLSDGAKHVVRHTPLAAPGRQATRWMRRRRDELGARAR